MQKSCVIWIKCFQTLDDYIRFFPFPSSVFLDVFKHIQTNLLLLKHDSAMGHI